jgi:hypothetical protein
VRGGAAQAAAVRAEANTIAVEIFRIPPILFCVRGQSLDFAFGPAAVRHAAGPIAALHIIHANHQEVTVSSRKRSRLGFAVATLLAAGNLVAQQPRSQTLPTAANGSPGYFGTQSQNITFVTGLQFVPANDGVPWGTSGSKARVVSCCGIMDFYANLDLPQDVIIDYIGINNISDTPAVLGAALYGRSVIGDVYTIASVNSTVGGTWHTDRNPTALGFHRQPFDPLILHVQGNSQTGNQFFAHVEVRWRRKVGPPFGTAVFDDVPAGHPQRQFVERLFLSGITAGCAPNLFCPDQPVTRGQMAVFLAVALGL